MKEISISAAEMKELNPDALPSLAKDFSSSSFWQYTQLKTADLILSSGTFRVSNLNGMKDLDEAKQHETERDKVFALCFCNSNTEKIPLWYLYSGLSGSGAALGFTPAKMLKWLHSISTVRGVKNGQKKEDGDVLSIGTEVELQYGWVYYQKAQEPNKVKYRNEWYNVDNIADFQKDNYFIKCYPWEYEREYRLVFINRTKKDYDALFVEIPPDVLKETRTRLAPELKPKQFGKISGLKCIGVTHNPLYSKLSIRMNLLNRNSDNILAFLEEEMNKTDPKIEAKSLCEIIDKAGKCKP